MITMMFMGPTGRWIIPIGSIITRVIVKPGGKMNGVRPSRTHLSSPAALVARCESDKNMDPAKAQHTHTHTHQYMHVLRRDPTSRARFWDQFEANKRSIFMADQFTPEVILRKRIIEMKRRQRTGASETQKQCEEAYRAYRRQAGRQGSKITSNLPWTWRI